MNESPELPPNTEITGPMSLGSAVASSLGRARGGTIAGASQTGSAALAKLTPQETNARMEACLQRISGQRPVLGRRMMFPDNAPAYSISESASWKCTTESQRNEALAAVEFALRPAAEEESGAALYTLRIMTRGRDQRTEADREAEALIWQEHLRQFPADIVLTTLRNWTKRHDGQWWPTWHDVQKELDAMASSRRLLADHIRSSKCLPPPSPPDDDAPRTDEQQARIDGMIERWREANGMQKKSGKTVVDRDAIPEAKRAELDRAVNAIAESIKANGLPKLSDEARALFREQAERAVPSPGEQFDEWDQRPTQFRTGKEAA